MLEVSLLGAGAVPRLETEAWSMLRRVRQATNEYASSLLPLPPSPLGVIFVFSRYRTIMAYESGCVSAPRVNIFSNPDKKYANVLQGSATENNARVIRQSAVSSSPKNPGKEGGLFFCFFWLCTCDNEGFPWIFSFTFWECLWVMDVETHAAHCRI